MEHSRISRNNYQKNMKENMKKGYIGVIGCLLISISVGEFNLLSNLYPYIASYYKMKNPKISQEDMNYIPMIWLLATSLTCPISIAIYKKLGYRVTFALFLSISLVSAFASSYIDNYWLFLAIYPLFGGVAQSGCIILPLYCAWRYFPAKYKAKISGILLSAYALAPIPSSIIALYIINPKNMDADDEGFFPDEVAKKMPNFFRIYSIGSFIFGMAGVFMIIDPLPVNQEEEERKKMQKLKKGKKKKKPKKVKGNKTMPESKDEQGIHRIIAESEVVQSAQITDRSLKPDEYEGGEPQVFSPPRDSLYRKAKMVKEKIVEKIESFSKQKLGDVPVSDNTGSDDYIRFQDKKKKQKFGIPLFDDSKNSPNRSKTEDGSAFKTIESTKQEEKSTDERNTNFLEKVEMIKTDIQPFKLSDLSIFKNPVFLNCYLILLIEYIFPHFGLFSYKKIGLENDRGDRLITLASTVGSIFNATSRLVIGLMYESYGYAACAYTIMIIEITSSLVFYPAAENNWSFLISICWFYNTYGAQLGLYPLVTDTLFKSKGAFTYSILFSAFSFSSVIILFNVKQAQKIVGGYDNLMYVLCVVAVLPAYNIWILNKKIKEVSSKNVMKKKLRGRGKIMIPRVIAGRIKEQGDVIEEVNENVEEEEEKEILGKQPLMPFGYDDEDDEALV